jgi:FkbM family methyltransferase
MNKTLLNIISLFISGKEKRHSFRKKYIQLSIFEVLFLKGTIEMINEMKKTQKEQIEITKEQEKKIKEISQYWYNTSPFLHGSFAKNMQEYEKDKENLLKNLSLEAEKRCKKVINIIELIFSHHNAGLLKTELWTKEELLEIGFCSEYMHQIKRKYRESDGCEYYELDGYKLPVNHFEPSVFYYKHGIDTLKTKLDEDKAIIDVGCFIADSCLVFRRYYLKNKIYTFEPNTDNYKLALKTIELNKLDNIVIENIGLGDKQENLEIFKYGSGSSVFKPMKVEGEELFKCDTLDNYVKTNNIKVGMIKVDIEGFEQMFLKGAFNTIIEQKPILLLSIYHTYNDFFKIKPLIESWNLGYKFDFFKGMDGGHCEVLLMCEVY